MFVPTHVIEYWEMAGDRRTQWTPTCLTCAWIGGDGTRAEAQEEVAMHERGERPSWVLDADAPIEPWRPGDPTMRSPR